MKSKLRLTFAALSLKLVSPLRTARAVYRSRSGFSVTATDGERLGLGEATPLVEFGTESHARCAELLGQAMGRPLTPPASLEDVAEAISWLPAEAPPSFNRSLTPAASSRCITTKTSSSWKPPPAA